MTGQTAPPPALASGRVLLRPWRPDDRDPFAAINADPEVMEHFPGVLSKGESDVLADRMARALVERGWGLWAAELAETGVFMGFVGLNPTPFEAAFTPATEIGWRLARPYWGHGLATEAARTVLGHAFENLGSDEIVSFTTTANHRSRRVMAKLGMSHVESDDFDHPGLAAGHPQRRHVLYRISRPV
ncbi:MAG: GNAT family N-acetyltransferase [Acidimicrobiales bacterium]